MNSLQSSRRDDFDSASRKSVTSKHSSVSYKWNHRLHKPISAHDEDAESYKWDRHLNKPIKIPIRSLEADHAEDTTSSRKSISSKHSYKYNRRLRKPTQLQPYDGLDVVRWDHKTNKPSKTKVFQRSKLSTPAQKEIQSDGASLHDWSTIASDTIPLPAKPRKFTWDASSSISPSYTRNSPRSVVTFDVISEEEEDMNMNTTSKPNNGRQQPYASRSYNRTRPRSASSNAARKKRVKEMEVKVMLHQISSSASSISSSGRQLQKLERKVEGKQAASASSDIESNIQDKENDNGNDNDNDNDNDNEIDAVKMKKLADMDAILAAKDMLLKEQQQLIRELSNQVETMSLKESTRVDVKRSEHAPAPIPDEIIAPLKDHGHGHENLHHANEHDRPTSAISNLGSTVDVKKRSEHAPAPIPDEIIAPLKDHGHENEHENEQDRPTWYHYLS